MAGISLAQAQEKLEAYLDAEEKVLAGQSVTIAGRTLGRADLGAIQQGIEIWDARVKRLSNGGIKVRRITPVV